MRQPTTPGIAPQRMEPEANAAAVSSPTVGSWLREITLDGRDARSCRFRIRCPRVVAQTAGPNCASGERALKCTSLIVTSAIFARPAHPPIAEHSLANDRPGPGVVRMVPVLLKTGGNQSVSTFSDINWTRPFQQHAKRFA